MTPTIVHRYSIATADALRALLDIGDCEKVDVFIVGENLVFDIIAPAEAPASPETSGQKPGRAAQAQAGEKPDFPADEQSGETSPDVEQPEQEPELKGGPLARRAAICCQEKGFQTFVGVADADEAKVYVCRLCKVESRKELDHDGDAAIVWKKLEQDYRFWLGGGDVTAP